MTTAVDIAALIEEIRNTPWPDDIAQARRLYDDDGPPLASDIAVSDVIIGGVRARRLIAPGIVDGRRILFLHGGGYVYGSALSHQGLAAEIGRAARAEVFLVEYRLAPEHPHPACVDDSVAAYAALVGERRDAQRLAVFGDSAGGGLAVATLLAADGLGLRRPDALVCVSPWVDLTGSGSSLVHRQALDPMIDKALVDRLAQIYAGETPLDSPLVSPLWGDLSVLPPTLVQVGEREVLFSEAAALARKAEEAGVDVTFEEWPDMIHVWHLYFHRLAEGRQAIGRIGDWLEAVLGA